MALLVPKTVKVVLAASFAMVTFAFTSAYFPETRGGYFWSSVLFVMVLYPLYRVLRRGSDSWFVGFGMAFVALSWLLHELQPHLPVAIVKYSAVAMVLLSAIALFGRTSREKAQGRP